MGNTCNSMADSCQCMTKPTTNNQPPTNKNKLKKQKQKNKIINKTVTQYTSQKKKKDFYSKKCRISELLNKNNAKIKHDI